MTLGGREIQLIELNIHSDDATVIWLPAERILLAGDTLEDTVTYVGEPENFDRHLEDLDRLWALDPAFILPNHGDPDIIAAGGYSKMLIRATQDYIRALQRAVHDPAIRTLSLRELMALADRGRLDPIFRALRRDPPQQCRRHPGRGAWLRQVATRRCCGHGASTRERV